ncbi:hypothetical protein [Ornithinimicrobium murale]|uniref:hypothetical protein n=1 Tax=Ornithinimicrobium murale TaxID=1050153 RepID=UPI000E0D01A9|nr:hypothetical protein [Ornithinimicrobium murale]
MAEHTCRVSEYDMGGTLRGCTEKATGWRLTHDGSLEVACGLHSNAAGERLARAEAEVARLRTEKLTWKRRAMRAETQTHRHGLTQTPSPETQP